MWVICSQILTDIYVFIIWKLCTKTGTIEKDRKIDRQKKVFGSFLQMDENVALREQKM